MPLAKPLKSLRGTVSHLLANRRLEEGTICSFDQLISPLILVGGHGGDPNYAAIYQDMATNAFKNGDDMIYYPFA